MFQSTIVDVVIGLIFTFCAVSLAVSALTEALATALKWRAKNLLDGVADLLNDPQVTGLALDIYNHGLVNPQSSGTAKSKAGIEVKPSYIDPRQFASAFVEVAGIASNASTTTAAQVNGAIAGIPNPQLQKALQGMADRAGGDLNKLRTEISQWFDDAMDRVSGIYKRRIQVWSFVIALLLCIDLEHRQPAHRQDPVGGAGRGRRHRHRHQGQPGSGQPDDRHAAGEQRPAHRLGQGLGYQRRAPPS